MGLMDNSDGVFMDVISSRVGSSDRGYSIRCLSDESTIPEPKSSSSESSSSSLMQEREPCDVEADENCIKDERDGHTYRTVKIGDQTWMAENLNYAYTGVPYKFEVLGKAYTSDSISWCYNDSAEYCEEYGRLYEWAAAMEACPMGWHLPSKEEWHALFTAVGDSSSANLGLKSTSGWVDNLNGSDTYGFSMLPGGFRDVGGVFVNEKRVTFFWSSADNDDTFAYYMNFVSTSSSKLNDLSVKLDYKNESLSVRCVKD